MITCSITGIKFKVFPAPEGLRWPHPALSYGFNFPKPRSIDEQVLQLGAGLYTLARTHEIVELRDPMQPNQFSPVWLSSIYSMLLELHKHLQGVGTDRLRLFPKLIVDNDTTSTAIERWLNECLTLQAEYTELATPARDKANEEHRRIIAARAKAIGTNPVERLGFIQYLERCAVDCALDGDSKYSFLRTCKNPQGSSDRAINSVLAELHDWAPQETLDDQLNFDTLIQRLTDALLDSRTKAEARQAQLNAELSKGLFRQRAFSQAPTVTTAVKEKQQGVVMSNLATLLSNLKK